MRTLLVVVVLFLVAIVGVGFYRGWFSLSRTGDEQKSSATITIDKEKIQADKEKAKEKVKELEHKGQP